MTVPPDPKPQGHVTQLGQVTSGSIAVWAGGATGQLQDGGTTAVVKLSGLPTSDPHVVGQLWSNSGAVTVSAG